MKKHFLIIAPFDILIDKNKDGILVVKWRQKKLNSPGTELCWAAEKFSKKIAKNLK
jgi:hypothetical protein